MRTLALCIAIALICLAVGFNAGQIWNAQRIFRDQRAEITVLQNLATAQAHEIHKLSSGEKPPLWMYPRLEERGQ